MFVGRMGAHYKKGGDPSAYQDFEIERIIMHESYKKPFGMSHDIALLKLSTQAQLNQRVALACLPDKSMDLPIDDIDKKCWITGQDIKFICFCFKLVGKNSVREGAHSIFLN